MKLRKTPIIFTLLLTYFCSFAAPVLKINFIENNLESAKLIAKKEGKLIMVDFWADWCSPCKWMDEETFSKPEVASYLNKNYISVRVDIDNFDGLEYKNKYDIRFLPTILVIDANGKVVKKYEESMAPSKLLRVLKDLDENKILPPYINRTMVQSVSKPAVPREKEVKEAPNFVPSTTRTAKEKLRKNRDLVTKKRKNKQVSRPEVKIISAYTPTTTSTNTNSANYNAPIYKASPPSSSKEKQNFSLDNEDAVSDIGLYQMNVRKAPKYGYSVQVGAYYDYKNVLIEVAKFQRTFAEEVLVHISELNGSTCYKIMLGHYTTHQEASNDKGILRQAGAIDAFVKDLATL